MKKALLLIFFVIVFLLIILTIALLNYSVNPSIDSSIKETLNFTLKTVAICEDKDDSIYCHDELILNCNNEEYVIPKTTKNIKCGDISLDAPLITAFATFDKDWKDPRKENR